MGTPEQPTPRMCVQCGKSIAMDANVCPYCGKDYRVQAVPPKKHTAMPLIGGILILLGALHEVYMGLSLAFWSDTVSDVLPVTFGIENLLLACGIILLILAVIGIIGGIFAVQRKKWTLAILGGVFSLLGGYVIIPLIGLILVAVSKEEFS